MLNGSAAGGIRAYMSGEFSSERELLDYLASVPEEGTVGRDRLRDICDFSYQTVEARQAASEALTVFLRRSYGFPCDLIPLVAGFLEAEQHLPALKPLIKHRNALESDLGKGGYIGDDARAALASLESSVRALQSIEQKFYSRGPRNSRLTDSPPVSSSTETQSEVPDLAPLVGDEQMREILVRRWRECEACLLNGAPLSAIVMMGGLLEALLLARVQQTEDKAIVFRAMNAPKCKGLKEWSLKHYLDVAHELGWISQSAKDVGVVLRDYRNYVHPQKEFAKSIVLTQYDAVVLWEVVQSIAFQIIELARV